MFVRYILLFLFITFTNMATAENLVLCKSGEWKTIYKIDDDKKTISSMPSNIGSLEDNLSNDVWWGKHVLSWHKSMIIFYDGFKHPYWTEGDGSKVFYASLNVLDRINGQLLIATIANLNEFKIQPEGEIGKKEECQSISSTTQKF